MLNINIFSAARAGNVMQVEEITLFANHIILIVLQYRVALGTDDFPSLLLIVIVFQYLHILFYLKYRSNLFKVFNKFFCGLQYCIIII